MQPGFFDLDDRHQQLEKLGDPQPRLAEVVDWESFRPVLEKVHQKERKSNAGRRPFDVVLMFKVLVLQHLYNLADDPGETNNLYAKFPDIAARLLAQLQRDVQRGRSTAGPDQSNDVAEIVLWKSGKDSP